MVIKVELAWIAESLKKAGYRGREEINGTIDGITIDTRRDCRGKMFVALSGEVRDGHDFLEQAVEKGAGALLIARERQAETERLNGSAVIFAVPDTLKGLQRLASSWREEVGPRVIGITGSTGKTGTKEIANLVFSKVYRTHATAGNYNNHIGLPLTLLSMERDTEICLAEMGANHRKEIDTLCRIARPSMGVITNIGPAHLEYFGDLKGVARAKAELIESLEEGDTAILPADDEFIEFLRDRTRARIKTFGLGEKADYRIEDIENRQEGGGYRFRIAGTAMEMTVYGRHHILNGAAAAAAALEMDIPAASVAGGLAAWRAVEGRGVVYDVAGITFVDDSYNSNPVSLKSAVEAFLEIPISGKRWLVLGDMLELGEGSTELHGEMGIYCGRAGVEGILTLGNYTAELSRLASVQRNAPENISHFLEATRLASFLDSYLNEGDAVLVKGSRGMHMEKVIEEMEKLRQAEKRRSI